MSISLRRSGFVSALIGAATFATVAVAQTPVVVVELFTSQGCSSCPPADKIFAELSEQDDVIALGQHVNYWDYLGWKDNFAQEKFAVRQEYLNMNIPSQYRRVTPQMVFNGQAQVAGARAQQIAQQIRLFRAQKPLATMDMQVDGGILKLRIVGLSSRVKPSDIHLVHYIKKEVVPIERGENRGRTVEYRNIVSSWETIGQWNGSGSATLTHKLRQNEPFAVLVQGRDYGPIYAAQRLD